LKTVTPNEKHQPNISLASSQIIEFWVDGIPRPQGSKRYVGNGRMVEASPHVKGWRDVVSTVAFQSMSGDPISTPVGVAVHFLFSRPKSHYRTGKNAHLLRQGAPDRPTTRSVGDTDKLCRAILDSISCTSGGGVLEDDSQVVWLYGQKDWAQDDEGPGAYVRVVSL
jgi:crossover junction endodeoxyribonuclease RusA